MKKLITALFLWTIVLVPATQLFAQEPESFITQDPSGSSVAETVVLADVNVTDVIVSELAGVLTGSFALQGKLGQQTDIVYGVVVVNTQGDIVAVAALGEVSAVQEQEIRTIPFTYTLPSQLRGEVQVLLTAETKQGLPLGTQLLATKSYPDLPPTMTCEYRGQYSSPACTAAEKGEYTAAYYRESLLTEPELSETVVFEAGVATALFPEVGPGAYTVLLTNSDGVVTRTTFNRPGEYGTILNSLVSTETAGVVDLTVTVEAKSETGLALTFTLTDTTGSECVTNTLPLTGTILKTTVQTTCTEGTLTTALKTGSGQVLDTRTQSFSVLPYAAPVVADSSWVDLLPLAGLALIILLLVIIYVYYRRDKDSHIVASLFMAGCMFFASVPTADAQTLGSIISFYAGEVSHMVFTTVTTNQSSYAPGEAIILSTTASFNHDAYGVSHYLSYTLGFRSVSDFNATPVFNTPFIPNTLSSAAFNGVFGPPPYYQRLYSGPFSQSDSITFTAPTTPGNYYLALRPLLESTTCPTCAPYNNEFFIANVNFTVEAPPPPPPPPPPPVGTCQLGPEQAIESGPTNMFAGTPPCQSVDDLAPYVSPSCPVGATTGTTVNLSQLSTGGFCATRQTQQSQCFGTAYVRACSGNTLPPPAPDVHLEFRP